MSDADTEDAAKGECPFCGVQGLITDPESWCSHHAATYDVMMGTEPADRLADDEEFDAFRAFLSSYQDLEEDAQKELCARLPGNLSTFLQGALENSVELFWLDLLPAKSLEADLSETLFDTTYVSVFVEDADAARNLLREKTRSIMERVSLE